MKRKDNYGFNNFKNINSKKLTQGLIITIFILVTTLTIGFASFSASLVMKNIAMIRIDKTVRLTGIRVSSTDNNAIARTEEYNVSNIFGDIVLPNKNSTVKYEVDITNLGNVKMGALTQSPICTPVTNPTLGYLPDGNYNPGDEYICDVGDGTPKTFFVVENSGDNVSLILNANVGSDGNIVTASSTDKSKVAWVTQEDYIAAGGTNYDNGNNTKGPITANKALRAYTLTWTNLSQTQITLPTYDQLYAAGGNEEEMLPTWLYDYLDGTIHPVSDVTGYWTSTPVENATYGARIMGSNGSLTANFVSLENGIRPVITIPKSSFKSDSVLDYTIDGYNNGEVMPVCDDDNCTNGVTKKIYITIKYKDGIDESLVTSDPQSFNIEFNYKQIFKVTYDGVTCTDCINEVVEGNKYTATINLSVPRVIMGDVALTRGTDYLYDETTKLLTVPRVNGDIIIKEAPKHYTNGEVVYFNVDTGKVCTNYTASQSATGVKSGCMKFYAFNDDGGDNINLILDHNTTAKIAWNSTGSIGSGPSTLLTQLKTDTSGWKGTNTPSNYTVDQSSQASQANYTVDYSNFNARLITANEIAKITGYSTFNEATNTINYYFFDTNFTRQSDTCKYGNTTGCSYGWLYDRTMKTCTSYGCLNNGDIDGTYGYWTASSSAGTNTNYAWYVYFLGQFNKSNVSSTSYGVRPVIEVPKSSLVAPPICNPVTEATTGNVPSGSFNYGDEYTCDVGDSYSNTFFVLGNSEDNVSLIMKENFTDSYLPYRLAWCTDGGTDNTTCKNITATGSNAPTGKDYLGHIKEIFNKTGVIVSFPSASQIATASGKTFNDSSISGLSTWLYDYLAEATHPVSVVYGYWTITPRAASSSSAWDVGFNGILSNSTVNITSSTIGVRPVITISSSLIK